MTDIQRWVADALAAIPQPVLDRADAALAETAHRMGIRHVDGKTWWHDAPIPKRWHRCRPWTTAFGTDRCACGGLRRHDCPPYWIYRNARRKEGERCREGSRCCGHGGLDAAIREWRRADDQR